MDGAGRPPITSATFDEQETMMKHEFYKCPGTEPKCIEGRCVYCNGGLAYCVVCKKGEGELEAECPGQRCDDCGEPLGKTRSCPSCQLHEKIEDMDTLP